jgi:ABC-type phosphate/phosphonate transport system substrate-binding protein
VYDKYATTKNLRVVARFNIPHKVWIVRSGLDDALVVALQNSLLELQGEAALNRLGIGGFALPEDKEYNRLREIIEAAKGFE